MIKNFKGINWDNPFDPFLLWSIGQSSTFLSYPEDERMFGRPLSQYIFKTAYQPKHGTIIQFGCVCFNEDGELVSMGRLATQVFIDERSSRVARINDLPIIGRLELLKTFVAPEDFFNES